MQFSQEMPVETQKTGQIWPILYGFLIQFEQFEWWIKIQIREVYDHVVDQIFEYVSCKISDTRRPIWMKL